MLHGAEIAVQIHEYGVGRYIAQDLVDIDILLEVFSLAQRPERFDHPLVIRTCRVKNRIVKDGGIAVLIVVRINQVADGASHAAVAAAFHFSSPGKRTLTVFTGVLRLFPRKPRSTEGFAVFRFVLRGDLIV